MRGGIEVRIAILVAALLLCGCYEVHQEGRYLYRTNKLTGSTCVDGPPAHVVKYADKFPTLELCRETAKAVAAEEAEYASAAPARAAAAKVAAEVAAEKAKADAEGRVGFEAVDARRRAARRRAAGLPSLPRPIPPFPRYED